MLQRMFGDQSDHIRQALTSAALPYKPSLLTGGIGNTAVAVRIAISRDRIDLRRGDLLFGNRLSSMQAVMNVSADPWTHSAVVGQVGKDLATIEVGPRGCFSRSISDFIAAYRFVGVGRLAMAASCVDSVASKAEQELIDQRISYSWSACAVIEASALARRFLPAASSTWVDRHTLHVADLVGSRGRADALTCSGFVARCLGAACSQCRPVYRWPCRDRIAPWSRPKSVTDLRASSRLDSNRDAATIVRLASPSDLWVLAPFEFRCVVKHDLTTILVDLTNGCGGSGQGHHDPKGGTNESESQSEFLS